MPEAFDLDLEPFATSQALGHCKRHCVMQAWGCSRVIILLLCGALSTCLSKPLRSGFDDVFVGTLYHARANRPAIASVLRILHECLSFPQVVQVLVDPFLLGKI